MSKRGKPPSTPDASMKTHISSNEKCPPTIASSVNGDRRKARKITIDPKFTNKPTVQTHIPPTFVTPIYHIGSTNTIPNHFVGNPGTTHHPPSNFYSTPIQFVTPLYNVTNFKHGYAAIPLTNNNICVKYPDHVQPNLSTSRKRNGKENESSYTQNTTSKHPSISGCHTQTPLIASPLYSNIKNVNNNSSPETNVAAERRKARKSVMDNKKNSVKSKTVRDSNKISTTKSFTLTQYLPESSRSASLSKRRRNVTPIPMAPLSEALDVLDERNDDPMHKGISKDYLDQGDQNVACEMCNAILWKSETVRTRIDDNKKCYSICCGYGKVELPALNQTPDSYSELFSSNDPKSKYFLKNIRRFNSMFSFTSMGGKIDKTINRGKAPAIFRLSGQNYHTIGSLIPDSGRRPMFSQLYIYDTENEVANRQSVFGSSNEQGTSDSNVIDVELIEDIKQFLDNHNQLVKCYRMVRDTYKKNPGVDMKLRLIGTRQKDGRVYNLPSCSEVAALIMGEIGDSVQHRDIVVKTKSGRLERISELHPSYLALQYPLLFSFGEDGYRVDIAHRGKDPSVKGTRTFVSMREFFAYRIQDRINTFSLILNSKRLFQQFLVDSYTMIESERLLYIRCQQTVLRCESYEHLKNLKNNGKSNVDDVGQRVILPSSFTGSARYMMQNYLDAMALCRWYGYPDFFITITCNPKWPEMKRFLRDKTLKPEDRPDILCRLFKMKLDAIMKDLKDNSLLGDVQAAVYTVEFQKRGLPHAHICLFMHAAYKLPTVEYIDPLISAELPDKNEDPELYSLVKEFMIHGPCGDNNRNCPCMVDGKCSKNFPKNFTDHTCIDRDGYPIYRRRDSGVHVLKSGTQLDNRSVVPYNKTLLKRYQAHINVEWCNQAGSIKYLFKYINKGPDKASVVFEHGNDDGSTIKPVDEIKDYYDCRYVSACEGAWRIFAFDVHYRTPPVMRLPFHLEGKQQVIYGADQDIDAVLNKPSVASSMFTAWMECNKEDKFAQTLTYVQFPKEYVFKTKGRCWKRREKGTSVGRIHSVPPSIEEAYHLRLLLNKVKGPKSFADIRTVDGHVYDTFRNACYALGLLDDDREYVEAIQEASHTASGYYLRNLFATLLMSSSMSIPEAVWEQTWQLLADGILRNQRILLSLPELRLTDEQLKNLTLLDIENCLLRNNSTLKKFKTMPYPDLDSISDSNNQLILEELSYDKTDLRSQLRTLVPSLTSEQRKVFNDITKAVRNKRGGIFFLYGYGGTGKTFLWRTLAAEIRSQGLVVLNVASSGIASLLLSGGRTAHSRFKLPLDLTEVSFCNFKPGSDIGQLLLKSDLIIWDEAPMTHKHAFEALDRSMSDIVSVASGFKNELLFGGKVIVFGGDFRQILPVVPNGSRQDILNASISSSRIWNQCQIMSLTKNMRLATGSNSSDLEETKKFAKWLLDIGEGNLGESNDGDAEIDIPDDLLITDPVDPLDKLIDFVYPSILEEFHNPLFFQERSLLAPKNDVVKEINDHLLAKFPGEAREYLSSDSICPGEFLSDNFRRDLYSPYHLNGLTISGLPNHSLVLKVGVPVMLLRNIDQKNGLCNGTRLQVKALGNHVIEAEIVSGINIGTRTFISRLKLIPSDKRLPFKFQRRQFPLSVCFAMTINKSQGQSLSRVGLYLPQPVFTHGQLYVALSRVKSKDGLKILILDKDGKIAKKTSNVVYKEIFSHL